MSVLQSLWRKVEPDEPRPATGCSAAGDQPLAQSYRFQVPIDPGMTQVISFQELVATAAAAPAAARQQQEKGVHQAEQVLADKSSTSPVSPADDNASDKGSCYDSEDSFLDDAELVRELEPSRMKSKIDGFFINTGVMDAEEDPSYDSAEAARVGGGHWKGARGDRSKAPRKRKGGASMSPRAGKQQASASAHGTGSEHTSAGAALTVSQQLAGPAHSTLPAPGSGAPSPTVRQPRSPTASASKKQPKKKGKKVKREPPPAIDCGIAARVDGLREFLLREENHAHVLRARDPLSEPIDSKALPAWLEPQVTKIEAGLRIYTQKRVDWKDVRKKLLKHVNPLLAPWKLTEPQLRKLGDNEVNDDADIQKEIEQELLTCVKSAAQQQYAATKDQPQDTAPSKDSDVAASLEKEQTAVDDGGRARRKRQKVSSFQAGPANEHPAPWMSFVWGMADLKRYEECVKEMYYLHVRSYGRPKAPEFAKGPVVKKFHTKLAKALHPEMFEHDL
jgi:hypothetical protein